MPLRFLDEADLKRLLDMPAAIEAMRDAFAGISSGSADVPVRTSLSWSGGALLVMPGLLETPGGSRGGGGGGAALGAKLVTVVPGNRGRGRAAIHALVVLLDPETGEPAAVMDGEWLTALRTGAGSGLATDLLALPEAEVLAVVGAGTQARTQIQAVLAVRPIREVRIASRTQGSAEALAREVEGWGSRVRIRVAAGARDAVEGAQVVITATDALGPVLPADAVSPGTHLNAVGGYRPDMQELPTELTGRATLFVDQRAAALREAGDILVPLGEGRVREEEIREIGEVVLGRIPGRTSPDEVTVFKSVGNAAQDLAIAALALERARDG